MSIRVVWSDDSEPEVNLTLDRSYEDRTVEFVARYYSSEVTVTVGIEDVVEMLRMIGLVESQ